MSKESFESIIIIGWLLIGATLFLIGIKILDINCEMTWAETLSPLIIITMFFAAIGAIFGTTLSLIYFFIVPIIHAAHYMYRKIRKNV